MRIIIAALFILGLSIGVSAQDYTLKLMLKEGQRFSLSTVMDMNMIMSIAGQDMKMKTKMNFDYSEEVKNIAADGSYKIQLTFTRVGMDVDGIAKMAYDTDKKGTDKSEASVAIARVFDAIIRRKFYATISPVGKVLAIDGLKEWVDSLGAGMDPASAEMLSNIVNEDKLKSSLQSSFGYLPDHSIKIGDSWTQTVKMDLTIPLNADITYTLREVKGNIAKVSITSESHAKDEDYQMSGVSMKVNLDNTMKGNGELNMSTGIFSKTKMDINMKGTMEAAGTAIPLRSTGTSETTITSQK